MDIPPEEKARLRRRHAQEAVALAMDGRWEEVVAVNRHILKVFPADVDAYNRLGKALTELGRYAEAREAYSKALDISPHNAIARKNSLRLAQLLEVELPREEAKPDPLLFLGEMGKTDVVALLNLAPQEVLAIVSPGDQVQLVPQGGKLTVATGTGQYLGEVGPSLGRRLLHLMNGGNRYASAVASLGEDGFKVIIREVYQHPSQAGRPSFPPRMNATFRAYTREVGRRHELEEETPMAGAPRTLRKWEEEAELSHPGVLFFSEEEQAEGEAEQVAEEEEAE